MTEIEKDSIIIYWSGKEKDTSFIEALKESLQAVKLKPFCCCYDIPAGNDKYKYLKNETQPHHIVLLIMSQSFVVSEYYELFWSDEGHFSKDIDKYMVYPIHYRAYLKEEYANITRYNGYPTDDTFLSQIETKDLDTILLIISKNIKDLKQNKNIHTKEKKNNIKLALGDLNYNELDTIFREHNSNSIFILQNTNINSFGISEYLLPRHYDIVELEDYKLSSINLSSTELSLSEELLWEKIAFQTCQTIYNKDELIGALKYRLKSEDLVIIFDDVDFIIYKEIIFSIIKKFDEAIISQKFTKRLFIYFIMNTSSKEFKIDLNTYFKESSILNRLIYCKIDTLERKEIITWLYKKRLKEYECHIPMDDSINFGDLIHSLGI